MKTHRRSCRLIESNKMVFLERDPQILPLWVGGHPKASTQRLLAFFRKFHFCCLNQSLNI